MPNPSELERDAGPDTLDFLLRRHPPTCGNDRMDAAHVAYQREHGGDVGELVFVSGAMRCPVCGWTQPF